MAKITRIKSQKNQKRVNIYLDGKFAFGLPAETLVKAGLEVGQELTEKQIEDLIFKNEFQKLLDKTLRLISFRPRSEKEIKNYLKKNFPKRKTVVPSLGRKFEEEILSKLKNLGYIDDEKFTQWWLEQRAAFRPRGKFALRAELGQKGISREIIQEVVEEIDEVSLAQKAAAKKMKAYKKLSPREFRRKMSAFLSRQGFSWEVIKTTIDQLGEKD